MIEKKRGKLSLEEEQIILDNVGIVSIEDIAKLINRTEEPVKRFIIKRGLVHRGMSDKEQVLNTIKEKLKVRPYYPELVAQFTEKELEYFTDMWIDIFHQFREDVTPTEEMQIKSYLTTEILINRSLRERKRHVEEIDRLQQQIDAEYKKSVEIRDAPFLANLETQIAFARNAVGAYTNEHTKLSAEFQKIQKDLKATRDQRFSRVESAKESFKMLIRSLEDEDIRETLGENMEIFRMAKDHARKKLGEYHTYIDGQVDRPLLNSDTVDQDSSQDESDKVNESA